MPLNSIWKEENDKAVNMGLLIEVQVVACEKEDLHLGRCWWPLTSAHISRSLQVKIMFITTFLILINIKMKNEIQVVLGTRKILHTRVTSPMLKLNLHDPMLYLSPRNTDRRTIGSLSI